MKIAAVAIKSLSINDHAVQVLIVGPGLGFCFKVFAGNLLLQKNKIQIN